MTTDEGEGTGRLIGPALQAVTFTPKITRGPCGHSEGQLPFFCKGDPVYNSEPFCLTHHPSDVPGNSTNICALQKSMPPGQALIICYAPGVGNSLYEPDIDRLQKRIDTGKRKFSAARGIAYEIAGMRVLTQFVESLINIDTTPERVMCVTRGASYAFSGIKGKPRMYDIKLDDATADYVVDAAKLYTNGLIESLADKKAAAANVAFTYRALCNLQVYVMRDGLWTYHFYKEAGKVPRPLVTSAAMGSTSAAAAAGEEESSSAIVSDFELDLVADTNVLVTYPVVSKSSVDEVAFTGGLMGDSDAQVATQYAYMPTGYGGDWDDDDDEDTDYDDKDYDSASRSDCDDYDCAFTSADIADSTRDDLSVASGVGPYIPRYGIVSTGAAVDNSCSYLNLGANHIHSAACAE
jgi:hypothetical protein